MDRTDHYLLLDRADAVEETEHGLAARLGRERLRVDLVADDVVRLKISRGGVFDENPTFAVCVDPLAAPVDRTVERADGVVRLRTAAMVVSVWLDPFRIDVHRTDGTPGRRDRARTPTAAPGRTRRSTTPSSSGAGAGPRTRSSGWGEDRPAQPPRARLHAVEHRRAQPARLGRVHPRTPRRRPARRRDEHRVRPVLRLDPVLLPPGLPGRGDGRVVPRQRVPGRLRLHRPARVRRARRGRPVHRVRLRRARRCPRSSRRTPGSPAAPRSRRCGRWATTSAAGSTTRRTPSRRSRAGTASSRSRATPCGSTSTTWTATGSSPGTPSGSRTSPGCSPGWPTTASGSSRSSTPASSTTPATPCSTTPWSATCCAGPRAATSTSGRCGPATRCSPTSSPRRPAPGGASSTPPTCARGSPASGTT